MTNSLQNAFLMEDVQELSAIPDTTCSVAPLKLEGRCPALPQEERPQRQIGEPYQLQQRQKPGKKKTSL